MTDQPATTDDAGAFKLLAGQSVTAKQIRRARGRPKRQARADQPAPRMAA